MQNSLSDLNNHLFAQLERLSDENLTKNADKLKAELDRTKAVSAISKDIVSNAELILKAEIAKLDYGLKLPPVLHKQPIPLPGGSK